MGPNERHEKPRYSVTEETSTRTPPGEQVEPLFALKRRLRQLSVDLWIWELGSLLLSAMCVGAIMVILLRYDNRPMPNWAYGLTINGLISVLAVVAKASMILPIAEAISQLKWHWFWRQQRPVLDFQSLDAASRGPWGCLMLLCRPRQWSVASIGALITVSALLMEPSLQLIPTYVPKPVQSGISWVPRSTYYKDYYTASVPSINNEIKHTIPSWTLGTTTKYAFYSAIFGSANNDTLAAVPVCPTGNCTYPSFSSLGVCSDCTNLTSKVYWRADPSDSEWYLPNSAFIDKGDFEWGFTDEKSMAYKQTVNQTILDLTYLSERNLPNGNFSRPQAFECVMWLCVKTFSASVKEGNFQEKMISSWPGANEVLPGFPPLPYDYAPTSPHSAVENYTFQPPGQDASYKVDILTMRLLKDWLYGLWDDISFGVDSGEEEQTPDNDLGQAFYQAQQTKSNNAATAFNATMELSGPGPCARAHC